MGQYYKAIVLKNRYRDRVNPIEAILESKNYDNFSKLMEHSYINNSFVRAVEEVLSMPQFQGLPFVWCGDYADELVTKKYNGNLYDTADKLNKKFSIVIDFEPPYRKYLINYTKHQYVELKKVVNEDLVVHPLPLLCCSGNGRGGGDYYGSHMEMVGIWAYNRIGVSDTIPKGYKKLEIEFEE